MNRLKRTIGIVAIAALIMLAIPGVAFAYAERGATSSVDAILETRGCLWCHQTSASLYSNRQGPHGGYTTSTSACKVCHSLHAAPGVKLLPKATATATCLACHDGTGGFGVYGTVKARTGVDPVGGHSTVTDGTNVVPGGDPDTGGARVETSYRGEGGFLGCVDCHSPHASSVVATYTTERQRIDWIPNGTTGSTNLLKRRPNGSDTTATVYGSDWCAGCHRGRHSAGAVANHPVDSLAARADAYSYNSVPLAPWPGVIDIACDPANGNVLVADPGNARVQQFTTAGAYTYQQDNYYGQRFLEPRGVAIGVSSHLWLADSRAGNLLVYGTSVTPWGTWSGNPVMRASSRVVAVGPVSSDMTVAGLGTSPDGMTVAITDTESNIVSVRTGAPTASSFAYVLRPLAAQPGANPFPSSALGEFDMPTDATINSSGITYVVDSMNNRVQRFDASGVVIDSFGSYGSGVGQFNRPMSITLDAAGRVYVTDSGNHRIQRFSAAGAYEISFGSLGTEPGQFRFPSGIAINTSSGDMYVVDVGNSRIQRLTSAGIFVSQWGTAGAASGQFSFQPVQTGPMAYAPERTWMKGPVYGGRAFVMQDPRTSAQAGHGPVCQQCHEDSRNAGSLYDGVAVPAITMTVLDGFQNNIRGSWAQGTVGERDKANPRFTNFPHETINANMLVETNDDLCLNCHAMSQLP